MGIRGNIDPLSWDKSIILNKQDDIYTTDILFSNTDIELEYKFVIFEDDKKVTWENTPNRSLVLSSKTQKITDANKWNQEQVLDISQLKPIESALLLKDYQLIETRPHISC